jgi:transcriptional regulator with XRE-family HTH domain
MSNPHAGNGRGYRWLADHAGYPHDYCLLWPFGTPNGYGTFGHNGKPNYAHRFMCELVKGPPPSEQHEAAHECGNSRCCNPKHLSWKTPSDNQADREAHGTKSAGKLGKLTFEQAQEIRALRGIKTQAQIAAMYGVTRSNVSHIQRGKHRNKAQRGYLVEGGKYKAIVRGYGKTVRLGSFDTAEAATAAAEAGRERLRAGLPLKPSVTP